MATPTVSSDPAVQGQYASQVAVTTSLTLALRRLWLTLDPLASPASLRQYREGVALVAEQFSRLSISNAADFYARARSDAGVAGRVSVPTVPTPPRSLVNADLDWAMRARQQMEDDAARIQARVEGAFQKAVTDSGRAQVVASVEGDNKALGFTRVARPGACAWCLSLAIRRTKNDSRPGVYKSRASAGQLPPDATGQINRYHNNCHCEVVPVFDTGYQLEPHLADAEKLYFDSTVNSGPGESLNDFRRALSAERGGRGPTVVDPPLPAVTPIPADRALRALLDRLAA